MITRESLGGSHSDRRIRIFYRLPRTGTIASWIGIDRNWFYWDAADYTARDGITWMANSSIERALLAAQTAEAEHPH